MGKRTYRVEVVAFHQDARADTGVERMTGNVVEVAEIGLA